MACRGLPLPHELPRDVCHPDSQAPPARGTKGLGVNAPARSSGGSAREPQGAAGKALYKKRLTEARLGDRDAQYEVGVMCANGVGTRRNPEEAVVWFKGAAERGHPMAQYLLAVAHANGMGTPRNEFLAVQGFMKAAEQGHGRALLKLAQRAAEHHDDLAFQCVLKAAGQGLPEAQADLADRYALGEGTSADAAEALVWYERAARQGVARAQFALAARLEGGPEGEPDEAVLRWYRAAAAQGHPGAQLALVRLDRLGHGRSGEGRRPGKGDADDRRRGDKRWSRYAERGDADDQYHLGCMHEAGIEVEADVEEACRWYRMAAERGHQDAQLALARLLEAADPGADEALHWWQLAAERGSADAQYRLGCRHAEDGRHRDPLKALAWQLRAAEQGHPEALMAVHRLLRGGAEAAAHACLLQAAEQGHAQAQFMMGQRFIEGDGVEASPEQARDWLERAAAQGNADAQCALGDWHAAGHGRVPDFVERAELGEWHAAGHGSAPDYASAVQWYEQAAEQGHARAQWLLGSLYASGAEGVPRDGRRAAAWCKKAAAAGFAPAQATLGSLFAQAKKMDRAVPWWTQAAAQGDPEAQFNLANALRAGKGVQADPRAAFLLWSHAAAAGIPAAQTRVGLAYATGEGAALDPIEAAKWFILAQQAGDPAAAANCRHAASVLSPVQLAEAEWRADEWRKAARARRPAGAAAAAAPAVAAAH
jgi:TPR repeat protein